MNIQLHKRMEECPYTPHYHVEGNFTVCVLFSRHNIISVGFAKCNPNYDEFDEKRGREIALARAVKKLPDRTPLPGVQPKTQVPRRK